MLLSTINGTENRPLDLSVFINCRPEKTFRCYYNGDMRIHLSTWLELKKWQKEHESTDSCLDQWMQLLEGELRMSDDLQMLQGNHFLDHIGPYYYSSSNTRVYVEKSDDEETMIPSSEFGRLNQLDQMPEIPKEMAKYLKQRKSSKKAADERELLLPDIRMCVQAIIEKERISEQIAFYHALMEDRKSILNAEDAIPKEPDRCPQRPEPKEDLEEAPTGGLLNLGTNLLRQRKQRQQQNDYASQLKIYLVQYREFEKAGERYKQLLVDWPHCRQEIVNRCQQDLKLSEKKLQVANSILGLCTEVLEKSMIHSNYHQIEILERFGNYLSTGRCSDLASCMNLWEEEQQWNEIKASQQRIENTIHFLQTDWGQTGEALNHPALLEVAVAADQLFNKKGR